MPFGRYICEVQWHTVLDGGCPWPPGKGRFGVKPQRKYAIANCSKTISPMLPPGKHKRRLAWAAIPPFAKLLWSLFYNCKSHTEYVPAVFQALRWQERLAEQHTWLQVSSSVASVPALSPSLSQCIPRDFCLPALQPSVHNLSTGLDGIIAWTLDLWSRARGFYSRRNQVRWVNVYEQVNHLSIQPTTKVNSAFHPSGAG